MRPTYGPAAQGEVTVTVGGKDYTATLQNGTATVTLDPQQRGSQRVKAVYGGSTTVEGSEGSATLVVRR